MPVVSYQDRISEVAMRDANAGESFRAGARIAPKGTIVIVAIIAGIGAGIGSFTGGVLQSAIGGGLGAGLGYAAAEIRARRLPVANRASMALALTTQRLLFYPRSALNNRPTALIDQIALSDVDSLQLGPKRWLFPRHLTVTLQGGSAVRLEAVPMDDPDGLVAAFQGLD